MDPFEEKLAEAVRGYEHLYDSAEHRDYKLILKSDKSWREIAESLSAEESVCRKRWRYLRDKFAKAKRRLESRTESGDPPPRLFTELQWLEAHIRRRGPGVPRRPQGRDGGDWQSPIEDPADDDGASPASSPPSDAVQAGVQPGVQPGVPPPGLAAPSAPSPSAPPASGSQPPPAPASSFMSRMRWKRRRQDHDGPDPALDELNQNRERILRRLEEPDDAIGRFAQTIGDMLRKVAQDEQDEVMHQIYTLVYGHIKRHNANGAAAAAAAAAAASAEAAAASATEAAAAAAAIALAAAASSAAAAAAAASGSKGQQQQQQPQVQQQQPQVQQQQPPVQQQQQQQQFEQSYHL